jgi:S-adenosylmethionine:diacylglycerol 3-amino-3-carboxypropyl transferase
VDCGGDERGHAVTETGAAETVWRAGRFDARAGPKRILFGRMYEDVAVERAAFPPGSRVFCIASAGCTALGLCEDRDVVACDINPAQLAYAERRILRIRDVPPSAGSSTGEPTETGTAEKVMRFGRALMPLAGWTERAVRAFLELGDVEAQKKYWDERLDTWRFRTGFDTLMSLTALRAVYAPAYLDFLPRHFGAVVRGRMARCFSRHPNATNPYASLLLLGEAKDEPPPRSAAERIELVCADAASYLEGCARGSFDGFTLSNILDGAEPAYRERLARAVRRAAAEDAVVVIRSFGEPAEETATNRAGEDRAMLWGIVDVRPAAGWT